MLPRGLFWEPEEGSPLRPRAAWTFSSVLQNWLCHDPHVATAASSISPSKSYVWLHLWQGLGCLAYWSTHFSHALCHTADWKKLRQGAVSFCFWRPQQDGLALEGWWEPSCFPSCQAWEKDHRTLECVRAVSQFNFSHPHLPPQSSGYFPWKKTRFYKNKKLFSTTLSILQASCSFLFPAVVCIWSVPTGSCFWYLVLSCCFWRLWDFGEQRTQPEDTDSIKSGSWGFHPIAGATFYFLLWHIARSVEALWQAPATTEWDAPATPPFLPQLPSHLLFPEVVSFGYRVCMHVCAHASVWVHTHFCLCHS